MASNGVKTLKLFVGNIPWTVSKVELRNYFSKFGSVREAVVIFDKQTKISRGFGFVTFANRKGLEGVLGQNSHLLEGSDLNVRPADEGKT